MVSFGDNLRREREIRGVSLREIAQATKISVRFLQALEDGRLDALPGGMFPRAFVRQYASHLGLDVERTLADFGPLPAIDTTPKAAARDSEPDPWQSRVWMVAGGCILLTVVLVSIRPSARVHHPPAVAPLPVVMSPPAQIYPTPTLPPAEIEGVVLTLKAEQECWVEARVDGRAVLNRVLAVGETTTLEANEEIRLSVGNAGGLSLNVNNLPGLPLGRNGEVRKNILINRGNLPGLVQKTASLSPSSIG
jgi:cytoskeleton protein RodZ